MRKVEKLLKREKARQYCKFLILLEFIKNVFHQKNRKDKKVNLRRVIPCHSRSCICRLQKESHKVEGDSPILKTKNANYINLTSDEIEQIGSLHNRYLDLLFKDFDYSSLDLFNELEHGFKNIANEENIDIDFQDVEVDLHKNMDLIFQYTSSEAMDLINNAINESFNINNVQEFEVFINEQENIARSNLIKEDLDITLITLCVLRKLAYFWTSIDKGGSGIGENIFIKIKANNQDKITLKADIRGVLAADGAAAGGGMIVGAIAAGVAGGPLGWGFLVGVGARSAIASGWYALATN